MIESQPFGTLPTGDSATLYLLSNGQITVRVTDLGATIVGIDAPGSQGELADIVLGYDDAAAYYPNTPYFFGATVGPSANRVFRGEVPIDGTVYHLPRNEGSNNLHTDHACGLHALIWDADVNEDTCAITFTCAVDDGAYGLPGNRTFTVRYALDRMRLLADYTATTDTATFFNLTNHTYFNMSGAGSGSVHSQQLQIAAERYLPIDATSIPTGELRPVEGTPFDFRAPKLIGKDIAGSDEQLALAHGYDHCFCIDGYTANAADGGSARFAVRVLDPVSGRGMEVWTSLPGMQLYTGNFLDEDHGKGDSTYRVQEGFALEPQFFPATPSHPSFPQAIFDEAHPYRAHNEYRFFTA